jgi:hypothetical protein
MYLLSKSEVQFLQGNKHISKEYEYKLKSQIKKNVERLLDKDLKLLSSMFPYLLDPTKFSKIGQDNNKPGFFMGYLTPKTIQDHQMTTLTWTRFQRLKKPQIITNFILRT